MRAMLYEKQENQVVQCQLCAHLCKISEGKHGICGVRSNFRGELITLVGDVVTAINVDPIEKKPLYHFLPGSHIFSIGSAGCNFRCKFCQNNEISRVNPQSVINARRLDPITIVELTKQNKCPSLAFTYNEPTTFYELLYETAGLAKSHELKTVLVSNGYMTSAFIQTLARRIDAANIDLKGFTDDFYHKYCGGSLQPVLENLVAIKKIGWWLEVTTLLIPGINDSPEEITNIAKFIKTDLGSDTPWHISAFHGAADMKQHPSTQLSTLENARHIGLDIGLEYVYIGNVFSTLGSKTICPQCGAILIERRGYHTHKRIKNGVCYKCDAKIPGVFV